MVKKVKKIAQRTNLRQATETIVFPSRARILQRDYVHSSTEDINREIVRLRRAQVDAEEDVTRLRTQAGGRQKVASQSKADADALEALLETRK